MNVGDHVECRHGAKWQESHRQRDQRKARMLGKTRGMFMGKAAAYMHLDEAYVIESIDRTGGVKLRGFFATVSQNDLQISTKPVFR